MNAMAEAGEPTVDATPKVSRADDVLPNDLFDAVTQAGQATAAAVKAVRDEPTKG